MAGPTGSSVGTSRRRTSAAGYDSGSGSLGESSLTSHKNLHRFILFTAICTFFLIIAGGHVTSTDSGLSVPDWPNTYGHFMFAYPVDQMVAGILYEHIFSDHCGRTRNQHRFRTLCP